MKKTNHFYDRSLDCRLDYLKIPKYYQVQHTFCKIIRSLRPPCLMGEIFLDICKWTTMK